jgi:high-affinity nickel permease
MIMEATRFSEISVHIHQLQGVVSQTVEVVMLIIMDLLNRTILREVRNEEGFVSGLKKEKENFHSLRMQHDINHSTACPF